MALTNKPKRIVLFLILFFTALGFAVANATTEDNYENETDPLPRIYESTHTENGYKANIAINPYTTGIYATETGYYMDLTINPKGIGGAFTEDNYKLDLIPEKTFPHIPDLVVTNINTSKTVVGQNFTCKINAAVSNQVLNYETLYVTIYANATMINQTQITLTSTSSSAVTFTWNTTGFAKGNYTIKATAEIIPGETDLTDNTLVDGWVVVTIPGDIDGDYRVDHEDLKLLAKAYGSKVGDNNYDPEADINCDGHVDHEDLKIMARNYGEHL